ncbi:hypothetical protein RSSM_00101 [Rhodopirellula sallentina SM41]|uniref:Uncharacterized protein n=1 Tax=Rhodopirellula sallentina SM41 TaxID=1263870 RepID=M5UAJ7_9BACT|nr:hypothetical protein RSSM_00101 [Rhodopirellula sallentina SM41]
MRGGVEPFSVRHLARYRRACDRFAGTRLDGKRALKLSTRSGDSIA